MERRLSKRKLEGEGEWRRKSGGNWNGEGNGNEKGK